MTDYSAVDDEIKANAQYWGVEGMKITQQAQTLSKLF